MCWKVFVNTVSNNFQLSMRQEPEFWRWTKVCLSCACMGACLHVFMFILGNICVMCMVGMCVHMHVCACVCLGVHV